MGICLHGLQSLGQEQENLTVFSVGGNSYRGKAVITLILCLPFVFRSLAQSDNTHSWILARNGGLIN